MGRGERGNGHGYYGIAAMWLVFPSMDTHALASMSVHIPLATGIHIGMEHRSHATGRYGGIPAALSPPPILLLHHGLSRCGAGQRVFSAIHAANLTGRKQPKHVPSSSGIQWGFTMLEFGIKPLAVRPTIRA